MSGKLRFSCDQPASVLAVAVLTVALSGCANTVKSADPGMQGHSGARLAAAPAFATASVSLPAAPSFQQAPAFERAVLPIYAYELPPARQDLLADAQLKLQAECMSGFGVAMQVRYSVPAPASDPRIRRYGVSDLQVAQRYGYHLGPSVRADPANADASATSLSEQDLAVLRGTAAVAPNGKPVPAGGCTAVAARRLGLGVARPNPEDAATATAMGSVSRIDADSFQKSLASAETTPILADWGACMARNGYHFSSPIAAAGAADLSTAVPTRAEIEQAVADVRCKQSTGLVQRWAAVEAPIERVELSDAAAQLTGYVNKLNTQLVAAAAILAVPVPS